ncbi:MAG: arylsulfatase, partial [Chromatiaceae bacterium]|nr:arylsulfatase [Chromatiaceae bacterium]
MKPSLLGLVAVAALLGPLPALAAADPAAGSGQAKPNILVIFGDDVGWMNVSSYGSDIMGVSTPNIDRIGRDGLRLGAFYAQPSCTAGRAAFITGQLPVRTGLTTVGTPGSPAGLKAEDVTLAEILKTRGYATAQFGKNHLGDLDEHLPCRHGFDEFWGNLYHLNANEDLEDPDRPTDAAFRKKFDPRGIVACTAGGPASDEGPFTIERMKTFDDEVAAKSVAFLERRAKDGVPFFLWHNSTRQHVFIHVKDESKGLSRAGREDIYGQGLKEHDGHVGQLLAKLDETGLAKNTIVIYTSDNGAYQYMWPEGGTSPFRGDKGTTWEGGVRVPFLIRWPGAPAGRVSGEIVDMTDLLPTLAAAAGEPDTVGKLKAGATYGDHAYKVHLDGFDQTALFSGQSDKSARDFVFYYDETTLTAIRYHQFKVTFSAKMGGHWDDPLQNL